MKKYTAVLHANPNTEKVKYIGTAVGDSINELKQNARQKAKNWGNYGKIHVQDADKNIEFYVIA